MPPKKWNHMRNHKTPLRNGGINKRRGWQTTPKPRRNSDVHRNNSPTQGPLTFSELVSATTNRSTHSLTPMPRGRRSRQGSIDPVLQHEDRKTPIPIKRRSRSNSVASAAPSVAPSERSTYTRRSSVSGKSSRSAYTSTDYTSDDEPQVPVYLLTEFDSIVEEAQPGSLVALDIDETIIVTKNSPSLLLTQQVGACEPLPLLCMGRYVWMFTSTLVDDNTNIKNIMRMINLLQINMLGGT